MSLARRTIESTSWNFVANLISLGVGLLRSIILARLLPVEIFGIYAFASSIVRLTIVLPNFGMNSAFLHRSEENRDEKATAEAHLTLSIIFTIVWIAVMLLFSLAISDYASKIALITITLAVGGLQLTRTPRLILIRRVEHRRLALINVINTVSTSIVSIVLALNGVELWALLVTDFVTLFLNVLLIYLWRPIWKPSLSWKPPVIKYFLSFGRRSLVADILQRSIDRIDDLWAGIFLGPTSLGFYSRAYTFATYPREILAVPVNTVAGGTYAELKHDRIRLSKAFFRTNAFMVRSGFLLGGWLALVAPELIAIALTPKWLPMLQAFRLMLIFTILDPIKITVADLFVALGRPEKIIRARFVQILVLILGLFVLGNRYGIAGVAMAVNVMLVIGIVLLLWDSRRFIDFSVRSLFFAPSIALILALASSFVTSTFLISSDNLWKELFLKSVLFGLIYPATLLIFEKKQTLKMIELALNLRRTNIQS